jgi:CheY-like chemotaxis protein
MRHYTILLIDYEPRSIERVRRPLTEAGFLVRLATDGVSGISTFEELEPDLVIIEAMIPKKHGFEVCQEIKRTPHGKRTPVFVQTAVYKGRKYRSQALHIYNCDEYLEKPYSDEFLVETVRMRLGIPRGEKVLAPDEAVEPLGAAPEIEVIGPDRPVRQESRPPAPAASGSRMPRDPDHPHDEEITQKLDDLFAMGGDEPRADAASPFARRQVSGALAATALAHLPDEPDPSEDGGASGELVDFEAHRAQRSKKKARREPEPPREPLELPPPPALSGRRGGFPLWLWAGLVGAVAVLCYLIFSGTI